MTPDATPTPDVVIGVALPVPEPWGELLRRRRLGYGEERARHIPTHITLLPPTRLAREQVPAVRRHLEEVAGSRPPFQVILRGTGTFRPVSDVVFVQVAQGVSSCELLEQAVRSGPLERKLSFPYHPHVTLAHDLAGDVLDQAFEELADFGCRYQVRSLRLYAHDGDEVWRPVADFPLLG